MQTKLAKYNHEPAVKGHYWGNFRKKCELLYSELGGHCFIHVDKEQGKFWMEIHTKGSVTSIVVKDLKQFMDYALSDHCILFVIWWSNSNDSDSERIVVKDSLNKIEIFNRGDKNSQHNKDPDT